MRMLFVADLHYALKQFDWLIANAAKYEVVIIGGDLLELASTLDIDVQIVVVEKYFARLRKLTRLIVSSGNHDGNGRNAGNESVARWLGEAKAPQLFVDGDSVDLGDTLITVCPWWDGPLSRAEVEGQFAKDSSIPKTKWVWIHHAPPDRTRVSWTGQQFAGDEFLVEWISRYQPDLVLSGHIHNAPFYAEGSWIDRLGKTWIFNPGRQIGPRPTFLSIDLSNMTVIWNSFETEEQRELAASAGGNISAYAGA
jgi:Icc-related predicted phosphoesterase